MSQSSQSPPLALLRLREADVVRLCGLAAAARGLDLVAHHAMRRGTREDARLAAIVEDDGDCVTWAELPAEPSLPGMRWGCARDGGTETVALAPLGCAHVAALLAAWVRHPEDFATLSLPASSASPPDAPAPAPGAPTAGAPTAGAPIARQPALLPPRATARPHAAGTLEDELRRLPASELTAVVRRVLGEELSGDTARERLAATLRDPLLAQALVARLDPGAGMLLATMLLMGGALTAADLDSLAQRAGRPASALRAELATLERHALLFHATGAPHDGHAGWHGLAGWRVPPEVRAALSLGLPIEPLPTAGDTSGPPLLPAAEGDAPTHLRIARAVPRRLALALALLARAPAPLGPLAVTPREARSTPWPAASAFAVVPGDLAPPQLANLARGAGFPPGLLRMARRIMLWARAHEAAHPLTELAAIPAAERTAALRAGFALWLGEESPAELADLDLISPSPHACYDAQHPALRPATVAGEVTAARAFVTRLVGRARPGAWYALSALGNLAWQVRPGFLRGRQQTYTSPAWWLEDRATGRALRPAIHAEWQAAEGALLRWLVAGPLHWWGATDLALDATGQPRAFRLTPFGAYLLDGPADDGVRPPASDALAGEAGPVALHTRDGGLAVEPLVAGVALLKAIERWARPTGVVGGRLIYALTPDLAAAAFDQALPLDALPARLRALGEPGAERAAEHLTARLTAWHARYGHARLSTGTTLLEAQDEAALAEALTAAPEIAARVRRLGPTCALCASEDAERLRALLRRRGYEL